MCAGCCSVNKLEWVERNRGGPLRAVDSVSNEKEHTLFCHCLKENAHDIWSYIIHCFIEPAGYSQGKIMVPSVLQERTLFSRQKFIKIFWVKTAHVCINDGLFSFIETTLFFQNIFFTQ